MEWGLVLWEMGLSKDFRDDVSEILFSLRISIGLSIIFRKTKP